MKYSLKPFNRGVSDQEVLDDLRRVAALAPNARLTLEFYKGKGKFSMSMVQRRFNGWNRALDKAGLSIVKLNNISDESWFKNIALVWEHLGKQPSYDDMRQPPSQYSPEGYANRFGGWRKALEAFVGLMNSKGAEAPVSGSPSATKSTEPTQKRRRGPRKAGWRLEYLVKRRDHYRCKSCGKSPATDVGVELEVDHIVPWDKGGETNLQNLQTLCTKCNGGKSNLDWEQ